MEIELTIKTINKITQKTDKTLKTMNFTLSRTGTGGPGVGDHWSSELHRSLRKNHRKMPKIV